MGFVGWGLCFFIILAVLIYLLEYLFECFYLSIYLSFSFLIVDFFWKEYAFERLIVQVTFTLKNCLGTKSSYIRN